MVYQPLIRANKMILLIADMTKNQIYLTLIFIIYLIIYIFFISDVNIVDYYDMYFSFHINGIIANDSKL